MNEIKKLVALFGGVYNEETETVTFESLVIAQQFVKVAPHKGFYEWVLNAEDGKWVCSQEFVPMPPVEDPMDDPRY